MPEERKLVTILFCDVTGSTALGEGLDPEDLRALMGRYYAHARRIIPAHGGTLEKFIGDAVMAVFGLPQAHSNDAERALAAALALRDAIAADTTLVGRLVLRLGVNTGQVVATTSDNDVSRGDFLVTGDAVNVAARLEQSAEPGEILVSARTAAAAESSFVFSPPRSISVKGKSQPLHVYSLEAQRPSHQPRRPALVGRADDLAQLDLLQARTLRERRPQLVSLVAPAGMGKTRLLEEFLARLDAEEGWKVATARCLPYGQTLSYWPLRGLLEELLDAPISHDAVAEVYGAGGYTPEDAQRLAGLALTALGIEAEGQPVEREALFVAWRLLIEALAKSAPRVIVFEDLHWASESLLDLVESIMQPRAEAALLLIVTSRPELLDRRPTWGGGRRSFTALALEPLSEWETQALVGAVAEGVSEETRAKIALGSGGNPFFAIELARGLAGEDTTAESLPDTVQEALQERLDALAPRERAVLQAAAVAGRTFRPSMLQTALATNSASATAPNEVELALEELLARDLIRSAEAGSYTFRHILIRDVAYNALSRGERIRLHLAVARWLEDFAAERLDEFVELLAYHYAEAAQLARQAAVPLEPPVDVARAVSYLEQAAAQAAQAGAYTEARRHLELAIALAPETEHRRLYEALGDRSGLDISLVLPPYRQALALWRAEAATDPLAGARLQRKLGVFTIRFGGGPLDEAQRVEIAAWRMEAERLAEQAGDEYERLRLRALELFTVDLGRPGLRRPHHPDLMAAVWQAADAFEARGDWDAVSEALDSYWNAAHMSGDHEAAFAATRRRLAAPGLSRQERTDAMYTLAWEQSDSGDYASANATLRAHLAQRLPGEPASALVMGAFTARDNAYCSGAWAEFADFDALVEEAWEETWEEIGLRPDALGWFEVWAYDSALTLLLALAREDQPAIERAAAALRQLAAEEPREERRQALQLWVEAAVTNDPAPLVGLLRSHANDPGGEFYLPPPDHQALLFIVERGLVAPERLLELIAGAGLIHISDAWKRIYAIQRALVDGDDAALAAAIDEAEAHGLIPHAARMRIVLAQRTSDRAQLDRARPALERLGDRLFLRRLEEALRALT